MASFIDVTIQEPYDRIMVNLDYVIKVSKLKDGSARIDMTEKRFHALVDTYDSIKEKIDSANK